VKVPLTQFNLWGGDMKDVYQHDDAPLDPYGRLRKFIAERIDIDYEDYPKKINLGCGTDYLDGWINVDGDPNILCELNMELDSPTVKFPYKDDSIDLIYASHVLEHIWYFPQLKKELLRILRPGGIIIAIVPHYLSPDAWGDETHCRAFSNASFASAFWRNTDLLECIKFEVDPPESEFRRDWIIGIRRKCGTPPAVDPKTKTTEHCSDCGWCCVQSNFPVPTNDYFRLDRMLELYYKQGHKLYQEPVNKKWYVLTDTPCKHYDKLTKKCDLYGTGKRPKVCRDFVCAWPGTIWERYNKLVEDAAIVLKDKFGEA
jgi:SAM-dependent methyltransferase